MNYDDFCELSVLAILNELEPDDLSLIEEEKLPELYDTIAALAYTVPAQPLPGILKERLWQRLEAEEADRKRLSAYLDVKLSDLKWQPHRVVPQVEVAIVRVDEVSREIMGYLRCQPNVVYPAHQHSLEEGIILLEGDLIIDGQRYSPGDYIYSSPGTIHTTSTVGGCIFLFSASLDDRFVELD